MLYTITETDRQQALEAADRVALFQEHGIVDQTDWMKAQRQRGHLPLQQHRANYFGALAEIAVATILDREWGGFWYGYPDVLPDIEVRSSPKHGYGPIITPTDLEDDRLNYVIGVHLDNDRTCFILGWCHLTYGYAGAQECAERRLGSHCKHYTNSGNVRVHPSHLRPINTLGAPK